MLLLHHMTRSSRSWPTQSERWAGTLQWTLPYSKCNGRKLRRTFFSFFWQIHLKTMPASTYLLLTGQEQPVFLWALPAPSWTVLHCFLNKLLPKTWKHYAWASVTTQNATRWFTKLYVQHCNAGVGAVHFFFLQVILFIYLIFHTANSS